MQLLWAVHGWGQELVVTALIPIAAISSVRKFPQQFQLNAWGAIENTNRTSDCHFNCGVHTHWFCRPMQAEHEVASQLFGTQKSEFNCSCCVARAHGCAWLQSSDNPIHFPPVLQPTHHLQLGLRFVWTGDAKHVLHEKNELHTRSDWSEHSVPLYSVTYNFKGKKRKSSHSSD